jgi:hypothetical protein
LMRPAEYFNHGRGEVGLLGVAAHPPMKGSLL